MTLLDNKKTNLTKFKFILIPFWIIVCLSVLSLSISNFSLLKFSVARGINLSLSFEIFFSLVILLALSFFLHINILRKKLWAYLVMLVLMIFLSFFVPYLALFSVYGLLNIDSRKEFFNEYDNKYAKWFIDKGIIYVISFILIIFISTIAIKYSFNNEFVKPNEVMVVTQYKSKKIKEIISGPIEVRLIPFMEESIVFPLTIKIESENGNDISEYIFKIINPRQFYVVSNAGNVSYFKSYFTKHLKEMDYKNDYMFKKEMERYGLELIKKD